jgi:hypothetical protein
MAKWGRRTIGVALWSGAILSSWANVALAQGTTLQNPLGSNTSFTTVLNSIISFILTDIAIPLCTIMALVGAFQLMTSAGDPEKTSKGRKTLLYAVIGFGVAICAAGLSYLIKNLLGQ